MVRWSSFLVGSWNCGKNMPPQLGIFLFNDWDASPRISLHLLPSSWRTEESGKTWDHHWKSNLLSSPLQKFVHEKDCISEVEAKRNWDKAVHSFQRAIHTDCMYVYIQSVYVYNYSFNWLVSARQYGKSMLWQTIKDHYTPTCSTRRRPWFQPTPFHNSFCRRLWQFSCRAWKLRGFRTLLLSPCFLPSQTHFVQLFVKRKNSRGLRPVERERAQHFHLLCALLISLPMQWHLIRFPTRLHICITFPYTNVYAEVNYKIVAEV